MRVDQILELLQHERFLSKTIEIVVGPDLISIHVSGNGDDLQVGVLRSQSLQQLRSVHFRHLEVCDHQVQLFLLHNVQRLLAVLCFEHLECGQGVLDEGAKFELVDDDENSRN